MRNDAREAAVNIIFSKQFNDECTEQFKQAVFKQFKLSTDDLAFAKSIVDAVDKHTEELLDSIENACHHYHVNRINAMDKSILLVAIAEIRFLDDVPPIVSVAEATNLAKKYSSDISVDFVNGVLAGVIKCNKEKKDENN